MPNVYGMVVTFVIATPWRWASQSASPSAPVDFKTVSSRALSEECSLQLKQYHLSPDDGTLLP